MKGEHKIKLESEEERRARLREKQVIQGEKEMKLAFLLAQHGKGRQAVSHAIGVKGAVEDTDGRACFSLFPVPSHPWEDISMDMIVGLPSTKVVRTQSLRL